MTIEVEGKQLSPEVRLLAVLASREGTAAAASTTLDEMAAIKGVQLNRKDDVISVVVHHYNPTPIRISVSTAPFDDAGDIQIDDQQYRIVMRDGYFLWIVPK